MSLPAPEPGDYPSQPQAGTGAPRVPGIPVMATLKEAWALVRAHPRTILLPMAAITVPLAFIIAAVNAGLFLSVWSDDEVVSIATMTAETRRPVMFGLIVLVAAEVLFAQVARAATIVALAGVIRGREPVLAEALDPAFTRLGGLLALIVIIAIIFGVTLVTVIGILALPYLMLRLGLAFDTYMIEGLGPWQALARSWALMRGNMLRMLALIVLGVLCVMPVVLALSTIEAVIGGSRTAQLLLVAAFSVVQSAVLVPVVAFLTACTTLYYFKTRARYDAAGPA